MGSNHRNAARRAAKLRTTNRKRRKGLRAGEATPAAAAPPPPVLFLGGGGSGFISHVRLKGVQLHVGPDASGVEICETEFSELDTAIRRHGEARITAESNRLNTTPSEWWS